MTKEVKKINLALHDEVNTMPVAPNIHETSIGKTTSRATNDYDVLDATAYFSTEDSKKI